MIYILTIEMISVASECEETLFNLGAQSLVFEAESSLMKAYFSYPPNLEVLKKKIQVEILSIETIREEDWLKHNRDSFQPILIGQHFRVLPTWKDGETEDQRWNIRLNPGLAFGTGGHETTRLCAHFLEKITQEFKIDSVLDVGCGTGLLALISSLLGVPKVVAMDHDPNCENCIRELLEDNQHLNPKPDFRYFIGSLDDPRIGEGYDCIVANILLETINELLPDLVRHLNPGGHLIVSGIPSSRTDEAAIDLTLHGLQLQSILTEGSWVALHARLH